MSTSGDPGRPGPTSSNDAGITGITLRAVIDARRRLDELGTAKLIGDAAEVVHKAQKQGQPLGVLSPETIVVRGGEVALALPATGTLAYSSPERVRGGAGDRRSDVFSLGVILWEALAHVRLFSGATEDAIRVAVLNGRIQPVSELNANVPAELDAICKKALSRDPADRYQSAKVMAAEISAVLDDAGYPDNSDGIVRWIAAEFPAKEPPSTKPSAVAPRPASGTEPPPLSHRTGIGAQTVIGMAPVRIADAGARPASTTRPPPISDQDGRTEVEAKPLAKPLAEPASSLPSWALGRPASSTSPPPIASTLAAHPGMQLPMTPPGATVAPAPVAPAPVAPAPVAPAPVVAAPVAPAPASPVSFASTAILGSPHSPPAPHPVFSGSTTAVLGSNAIIEATNAAVAAANPPTSVPAARHDLRIPFTSRPPVTPSISQAETVATPAVTLAPTPLPPTLPTAKPAAQATPTLAEPSAATELAAAPPTANPAQVVALPRPERAISSNGTDKKDVLAGWGWGTDSHEAISEDEVYDEEKRGKKRLLVALGGAMGVILVITVVAFAFSGGDKKKDDVASKKPSTSEAAFGAPPVPPVPAAVVQPPNPDPIPEPPGPDPQAVTTDAVTEPVKTEPANPEPVKTEPANPEPAKTEPAKTEPAKTEPAKTEPAKLTKVEPAKTEPAKLTKVEPARTKPEPKKPDLVAVKKPDPKKVRDPGIPKPVDPYAPQPPKLDAAAAYKTGLQQLVRGDTAGALTTFKSSLATDPGFAPTWRGIGLVYEKLGKKSQAKTAFRRYLQLSPNAGDAEQIRDRMEKLGT
ncbi:MAG: serine/threonine protein kinase with repeat [Deltaproteobacteria bacterium]|nr:serine/threonine protein kinase with repeat [Deltaproteobacteria bacterium]